MRTHIFMPIVLVVAAAGCSTTGDTLRLRANSPPIDDAFRRISVALSLDGYPLARTDPAERIVETEWRVLQKEECSVAERERGMEIAARIRGTLAPRGAMYDVFLTIILREQTAGGFVERPAEVNHPLITKWRKVLKGLVEEEKPEED